MISIDIKPQSPLSHTVHINITFPVSEASTTVYIPLWRPGRYERADFANNISNITATHQNSSLNISKVKSHAWQVETKNISEFTFSYDYFAHKMDAGNSVFDETQLYFNFISCIAFIPELMEQPIDLSLEIPNNYEVACPLKVNKGQLHASSYHQLVDSPLLASSELKLLTYRVNEYDFEIWINGHHPLKDEDIISDFKKFTQSQVDALGSFPTDKYLFIVQSLDYRHYHGVEHQDSTVLILGSNDDESRDEYYEKLTGVASHELFHTWNVTRIRPAEMSPYQYHEEVSHPTGFVSEGFTSYFGDLFLKASDTYSEEVYLKELSVFCNRHFQNFGRHRISLIESSKNLWIDGYKNIHPSHKVSIYIKGALNALILDLEIRNQTNHQHCLLDISKDMMIQHTYTNGGYTKQEVYELFKKYGGKEILSLAHQLYETSTDIEPLLVKALETVGLQINKETPKDLWCHHLGIKVQDQKIIDIHPESDWKERLSIGDLFLDSNEISIDKIDIIRNSQELSFTRVLDNKKYLFDYHITNSPDISTEQTKNKEKWLQVK